MDTFVIKLPREFSVTNTQQNIQELYDCYDKSMLGNIDKVIFDFSCCKVLTPAGMVFIKMWKDNLVEAGKKTFYRKSDKSTHNFLRKMGLLPIVANDENLSVEETFFYPLKLCNSVSECSDAHAYIISNVVQKDSVNINTYSAVDYMINEIWDNAGVHGYECYNSTVYPKPVYICALEYDDSYEVCIGDRGQGIFNSLKKNNRDYKKSNKKEIIKAAIQNGISGHPDGSPGFGLFSSAEFIRGGGGTLHIWSSGCYLHVTGKTDKIYNSRFEMGTLISFVFKKTAVMPFEEVVGNTYTSEAYIEDVIGGMFDE